MRLPISSSRRDALLFVFFLAFCSDRGAAQTTNIPARIIRSQAFAILTLCICTLLSGLPLCAQSNAITLPRNLGELVLESETVVQGWVTSVALEPHPQLKNLMTVVVTIRVEDILKGNSAGSHTFRQAVVDRKDLREKFGYRAGQHVLMILYKTSQFGLASPAGMEQGRFRIESGSNGRLVATNGYRNAGLFRGLDSQLKTKGLRLDQETQAMILRPVVGPIPLEHLKSLIRTISATNSTK
jgi:hypothetical protein